MLKVQKKRARTDVRFKRRFYSDPNWGCRLAVTFLQGLRDLMASGENLPTLPHVVFEVHRALDNEMVSSGQVADIVERDPALTSRLLRMANSAYFGGGRERVGTVTGAINRMGLGQVRGTCLVLAVVKSFSASGKGLHHQKFWGHSAYTGMVAQQLWKMAGRGGAGESYQNVYTCGLLHDVGLLVLDQFFPEEFQENVDDALVTGRELWVVEEEKLGMDHGEIGGLLMGRWSLPDVVSEAVAKHHRPDQASGDAVDLCKFVHAGEVIASQGKLSGDVEGMPTEPVEGIMQDLGFSDDEIPEAMETLVAMEEEATGFAGMTS